jgi:hypothetical protein
MRFHPISACLIVKCALVGLLLTVADGWRGQSQATTQFEAIILAAGFTPNPTVLEGIGGGDRPAEAVVETRRTPTGLCLGYVTTDPHEQLTLQTAFTSLEMRVESELDTTLIVLGPDGVWCNDDSVGKNPAIAGPWLPGDYRVWIGAYQSDEEPEYEFFITDNF